MLSLHREIALEIVFDCRTANDPAMMSSAKTVSALMSFWIAYVIVVVASWALDFFVSAMMSSAISFTLYDSRRFVIQSGAAMTQDTGRPPVLSHQDFVSEVQRTGLTPVTVETFVAYQFAASYSNKLVWLITGWMQMLFTSPAVSVAIVILAFVLRDWRILLAISVAIYGLPRIFWLGSYRLPDYQKKWRRYGAYSGERDMWLSTCGDLLA